MAFKPSSAKKNSRSDDGALNMNSMMDMMTIILLFLLKSFSTSDPEVIEDGSRPDSSSFLLLSASILPIAISDLQLRDWECDNAGRSYFNRSGSILRADNRSSTMTMTSWILKMRPATRSRTRKNA